MDGGGAGRWEYYLPQILAQANQHDLRMSGPAKKILNDLLEKLSDKISASSAVFVDNCRKRTVSSREVQSAVRVILPKELIRYAVSAGTGAVMRFSSENSKGVKGERREVKARLVLPVSRAEANLRAQLEELGEYRVNYGAPVYLAAVLEYLAAEILEIAGDNALDEDSQVVSEQNIKEAIKNDEDLNELFNCNIDM